VALFHLAFVLFVVLGGLLVLGRPRWAWVHLPAAVWGFWVEAAGWICPLTPLEQELRRRAGLAPWEGDFIARWLFPVLYPEGLSRGAQWVLAAAVVGVNALVYGVWIRRRRRARRPAPAPPGRSG
jgi:hypothetical protein